MIYVGHLLNMEFWKKHVLDKIKGGVTIAPKEGAILMWISLLKDGLKLGFGTVLGKKFPRGLQVRASLHKR